ncbi:MAG: zinc ribbon domain-containing protein [Chloroflexota bacterium]
MPIYEYYCPACQQKFELLRPLSACGQAAECPGCHQPAPRAVSVFSAMTRDATGATVPTGGSACGSCSSGSCATCGG